MQVLSVGMDRQRNESSGQTGTLLPACFQEGEVKIYVKSLLLCRKRGCPEKPRYSRSLRSPYLGLQAQSRFPVLAKPGQRGEAPKLAGQQEGYQGLLAEPGATLPMKQPSWMQRPPHPQSPGRPSISASICNFKV